MFKFGIYRLKVEGYEYVGLAYVACGLRVCELALCWLGFWALGLWACGVSSYVNRVKSVKLKFVYFSCMGWDLWYLCC